MKKLVDRNNSLKWVSPNETGEVTKAVKALLPNDFIEVSIPKRWETYEALDEEQASLIASERVEAELRIKSKVLQQSQRYVFFWSPGMKKPVKVTSMEQWDKLALEDRTARQALNNKK